MRNYLCEKKNNKKGIRTKTVSNQVKDISLEVLKLFFQTVILCNYIVCASKVSTIYNLFYFPFLKTISHFIKDYALFINNEQNK